MHEMEEKFFRAFGAYFDSDLIPDLRDIAATQDAMDGVVAYLDPLSDPERAIVKSMLLRMLTTWDWNKDVIGRFIQATNVDWNENAETEQKLKEILTQLSQQFDPYVQL